MRIKDLLPLTGKKTIIYEIIVLLMIMILLLLLSYQQFSIALGDEYRRIALNASGKIRDINVLLAGRLRIVPLFLAVCIFTGFGNYSLFRQRSMSVYTMKRISNAAELHVRCFTLPLIMFTVMVIASLLLLTVFKSMYFSRIPAALLPEYHGIDFWRLFI